MSELETMCLKAQKRLDEAAVLRTLNAFAVDVIAIPTVEDLFWYVAQNVVGRLNFVDCVIYRADDSGRSLAQVAAWGAKNPYDRSILNPLHIAFGQGVTGQVAQSGKPVIIGDLLKQQNYIPDMSPARSEICVPLVIKGRVVGVIDSGRVVGVIDSEHPDPNAFGKAELEILTTVAAMTSAKLELLAEAERSHKRYRDLVASHAQLSQEIANRKALEAKLFAARKLEAIGRLTGRFAHDFNNLLTVISGNLEFLAGDTRRPDAQASLNDAQSAASRGAELIRDMLAFSQRTRLSPELADLNEIVANVCTHAAPHFPANILVVQDLADHMGVITVDIRETENALRNLLSNAREAMPDGGRLHIKTEMLQYDMNTPQDLVATLLPGLYVCVTVQDEGTGIPDANLPQIFDPFYTSKPLGRGAGLGLSMVLGFMQQSGGSVAVTSKLHHGSRFRLYFPAVVAPDSIDTNDLLTIDH